VWKSFIDNLGHDANCIPNLVIESAKPNEVVATLKIERSHVNRNMTLHGGVILSLTDTLGSLALTTRGYWQTGVSTDISASFLRPAGKEGDIVKGVAKVVSLGKTLAATRVDFLDENGKLVAFGSHTKFVGNVHGNEKNIKFSEDGETIVKGKVPEP